MEVYCLSIYLRISGSTYFDAGVLRGGRDD